MSTAPRGGVGAGARKRSTRKGNPTGWSIDWQRRYAASRELLHVIVYRAEAIDITPTRPQHVLLAVEVISPGSETTDRIVKVDQYAKAGIPFYWRGEQAATKTCRDGELFTGAVKATAPFSVSVDLGVV